MRYNLIVALDFHIEEDAWQLVNLLSPSLCAVKVGSEMFTLFGANFITKLVSKGFKVFLDLKFHDIPTTVSYACQAAAELGVWMINVHASGGFEMMHAAREALGRYQKANRPLLIAVTVLTSFQETDLAAIGVEKTVNEHVVNLSKLAKQAGLDGVVASAYEIPNIKKVCGANFLTVTPGIRLNTDKFDQKRVLNPQQAIELGSDYLVIGRPITRAPDPLLAIQQLFTYEG
jgi:orotidine-5'-phosphate decarboxylase